MGVRLVRTLLQLSWTQGARCQSASLAWPRRNGNTGKGMPKATSLLACRFLPAVGRWGKGPLHTLTRAPSFSSCPCTAPTPPYDLKAGCCFPCCQQWNMLLNKGPPFRAENCPVSGSVPLWPGRMGRAASVSPTSTLACPGTLWQVSLRPRVERDKTKLGGASSSLGTAKTVLCLSWENSSPVLLGRRWGCPRPDFMLLVAGVASPVILSSGRVLVHVLSLLSNCDLVDLGLLLSVGIQIPYS